MTSAAAEPTVTTVRIRARMICTSAMSAGRRQTPQSERPELSRKFPGHRPPNNTYARDSTAVPFTGVSARQAWTMPGLRPWHQPASFDVLTHNVRPHVAKIWLICVRPHGRARQKSAARNRRPDRLLSRSPVAQRIDRWLRPSREIRRWGRLVCCAAVQRWPPASGRLVCLCEMPASGAASCCPGSLACTFPVVTVSQESLMSGSCAKAGQPGWWAV
jgi:hypothetical protein